MSINLSRRMGETYLDMESGEPANEFTYRMLENNRINGLIELRRITDNGVRLLSYKVTGMEPLSGQIKRRKYNSSDVRNLMWAIEKAREECKRYMIDPDGILYGADYIYYDYGSNEYKFIYGADAVQNKLRELMEYLMQNLDHSDEEAVRVIYSLYDCMDNENFDLEPYLNKFMGTVLPKKRIPLPDEAEIELGEKLTQSENVVTTNEDDYTLKDILIDKLKTKFNKKVEKDKCDDIPYQHEESKIIFEPVKVETYETILLADNNEARGNLEVLGTGEYYHIEKPAIIIGKSEEYADFVLTEPSVSRVHAEITHDSTGYYISDKNSKNGICINEEHIDPGRIVKLTLGDRIRLGNAVMLFS